MNPKILIGLPISAVEKELNELLDANGGISKRKVRPTPFNICFFMIIFIMFFCNIDKH